MQLTKDEIKNLQRTLKASGFDPGPIDGLWGSKTEAAYQRSQKAHDNAQPSETNQLRTFDSRSEANIKSLVPKAQVAARKFLAAVLDAGIEAKIISGNRTWAEQDALFAKRPQVTKARGGFSNHNFGIAWDIGIFKGGAYLPESPLYAQAGQIGRQQGLEWGGDWKSFKDEPHFNLKTGKTMAELRAAFLKGEPYV
ncbi:MAG TPA: M15 family metallopeptidase [Chthoniobacterales bacterium]|nr:M15 family metallopeptidase [Chthoniobacterales bacterium]